MQWSTASNKQIKRATWSADEFGTVDKGDTTGARKNRNAGGSIKIKPEDKEGTKPLHSLA